MRGHDERLGAETFDAFMWALGAGGRRAWVEKHLPQLEREHIRDVVCRYFGIGYERAMTYEEIAEEYGITRETIRRVIRTFLEEWWREDRGKEPDADLR